MHSTNMVSSDLTLQIYNECVKMFVELENSKSNAYMYYTVVDNDSGSSGMCHYIKTRLSSNEVRAFAHMLWLDRNAMLCDHVIFIPTDGNEYEHFANGFLAGSENIAVTGVHSLTSEDEFMPFYAAIRDWIEE